MILLPARLLRKRHLIPLLALTAMVGWYFLGDAFTECIDRSQVRHFHYQPDKTELKSGTRNGGLHILYLCKGECVKFGKDVTCYARSVSHHRLGGLRAGYCYVNVNGRTYWRPRGECGTTLYIDLGDTPPNEESTLTEEQIVQALRKDGFRDLQ